MKTLILRDIRSIKSVLIFLSLGGLLIYVPFFMAIKTGELDDVGGIPNIILGYYLLIASMGCINWIIAKNTNKGAGTNKLLRSLPINPKKIVISRFLEPSFIYGIFLIVNLLMIGVSSIILGIQLNISISTMGLCFLVSQIYGVISLGMDLAYPESSYVSYVRTIPFFVITLFFSVGSKFFEKYGGAINIDMNSVLIWATGLMLIVTVVVTFVMYKFSLRKFLVKEL